MNILTQLKQRYRYPLIILKQLVVTDFKLRYKGSVLGYVWTLLRPLALFAVLYVVFVNFLRFGADVPYFAIYLLLGVVLWSYFVEVTTGGVTAIVAKGDLMRKLSFPRYVIIVAGSISAFINLAINLSVVFIFMIISGVPIGPQVLLLPLLIAELFIFALSLSFLLGALYVRFRDINYVWEVLLQAGFYVTPIIYPISMVADFSSFIAKAILLNPMAQIIQDARFVAVTNHTVTVHSAFRDSAYWLIPFIIVIVAAVVSVFYFRAKSPSFAEDI